MRLKALISPWWRVLLGWKPQPPPPIKKQPYYFNDINGLVFSDWSIEPFFQDGPDSYRGHFFTVGHGFGIKRKNRPDEGDIWVKRYNKNVVFLEFTKVKFCHDPDDMYFFSAKQVFPETVPVSLLEEVAKLCP